MAKQTTSRKKRDRSGESSVANIINEMNGTSCEHIKTLPPEEKPERFFLVSDRGRKVFAWVIGLCTSLLALLTIYANVVRNDESQTKDIHSLQSQHSEFKQQVWQYLEESKRVNKETKKELSDKVDKNNKLAQENKNALQRVETMQGVVLQRLDELKRTN